MRVLRVLTRPNVGGPMRQAVTLWHEHARLGVDTLLVVGECDESEISLRLDKAGIPRLGLADIGAADARGLLVLPALRRRPRPIGDLHAVRQLRHIIDVFRPDVVHTHMTKAGVVGRRAAAGRPVPVVAHTFHGHVLRDYYPRPVAGWLQHIERRLAASTDLLIAISESCAAELHQLGMQPRGQLKVIPPAVDVSRFAGVGRVAARQALGVNDDRRLLAFVGRLVPIKRVSRFVHTIGMMPEAEGFVFGDGPRRERARALAGSRVHFFGVVHHVERYLAAFDALVITSDREGCPLVAIEAFAAGVPVVGYDVPGVCDVLGPWGDGVLVPLASGATGMADALRSLLGDPVRRDAIIARARAALPRFAPATVAAELLAAYDGARRGG